MWLASRETSRGEKHCCVCRECQITIKIGKTTSSFGNSCFSAGSGSNCCRYWHLSNMGDDLLFCILFHSPKRSDGQRAFVNTPRTWAPFAQRGPGRALPLKLPRSILHPPEGIIQWQQNRSQPYFFGSFFVSAASIYNTTALRNICSHLNGLFYAAKWKNVDFMSTSGASSALKTV